MKLAFGGSPVQWGEAILVARIDGGHCGWQRQQLGNQGLQLPLHAVRWLKHAARSPCCPVSPLHSRALLLQQHQAHRYRECVAWSWRCSGCHAMQRMGQCRLHTWTARCRADMPLSEAMALLSRTLRTASTCPAFAPAAAAESPASSCISKQDASHAQPHTWLRRSRMTRSEHLLAHASWANNH